MGKRRVTENDITRCVADICSFVMHHCVYEKGDYFNHESNYAWDDKYENIRNCPERLTLGDYKMAPEIFYDYKKHLKCICNLLFVLR